jgi:hypothetical protein
MRPPILPKLRREENIGSAVIRARVDIDDHGSLSRERTLKAFFDTFDQPANRFRIVVGRNSHKNVHFPNADQLLNQIICEKGFFCQRTLHSKDQRPGNFYRRRSRNKYDSYGPIVSK